MLEEIWLELETQGQPPRLANICWTCLNLLILFQISFRYKERGMFNTVAIRIMGSKADVNKIKEVSTLLMTRYFGAGIEVFWGLIIYVVYFELLSIFFLHFKRFSLIFHLKWRKKVWKNCVLSYSLKLVDMQTLVDSLRGCLKIVFVILMLNLIREKWEGGDIYLVNWGTGPVIK